MPRKVLVLPSRKPRTLPPVTRTTGGFRFGESAAFATPTFASAADAGSSETPANAPLTTAAPCSSERRFRVIDSDDGWDLRWLINSSGSEIDLRPKLNHPGRPDAHNVQRAEPEDSTALAGGGRREIGDLPCRRAEARRKVDPRPLGMIEDVVGLKSKLHEAV